MIPISRAISLAFLLLFLGEGCRVEAASAARTESDARIESELFKNLHENDLQGRVGRCKKEMRKHELGSGRYDYRSLELILARLEAVPLELEAGGWKKVESKPKRRNGSSRDKAVRGYDCYDSIDDRDDEPCLPKGGVGLARAVKQGMGYQDNPHNPCF